MLSCFDGRQWTAFENAYNGTINFYRIDPADPIAAQPIAQLPKPVHERTFLAKGRDALRIAAIAAA